jgi:hypothetical protein
MPKKERFEVLQANPIKKGFSPKGATSETSADHVIAELYPRQTVVVRAMIELAAKDKAYAESLLKKIDLVVSTDNLDYTG